MAVRKPDEAPRAGCPALRHDTEYALRRFGCCCPAAREIPRRRHRRHYVLQHRVLPDASRVAEAVAGRAVELNRRELALAIAELHRRTVAPDGARRAWSAREIARQVGCSYRTVQRHRAAMRERAGG